MGLMVGKNVKEICVIPFTGGVGRCKTEGHRREATVDTVANAPPDREDGTPKEPSLEILRDRLNKIIAMACKRRKLKHRGS